MSGDQGLPQLDLDEIERLARAATPGPWVIDPSPKLHGGIYSDDATGSIVATVEGFEFAPRGAEQEAANAAFIAAANPATVLALVAWLRAAEAVAEAARVRRSAVLALMDDPAAFAYADLALDRAIAAYRALTEEPTP